MQYTIILSNIYFTSSFDGSRIIRRVHKLHLQNGFTASRVASIAISQEY